MANPIIVTPPAIEPVTVDEAKSHLRINFATDDTYLGELIIAAREYAEDFLRRALITRTYDLYLDDFPSTGAIALPRPPLQLVSSVKYVDTDGDVQDLTENTDYVVDAVSEPGWVVMAEDASWPEVKQTVNAVIIRFIAGYGDAGTDILAAHKLAIKHMIAEWYEHREPVDVVRGTPMKVSRTAEMLLWPTRFYEFE
ncbi:MAG TPA: head-tail connector protein [Hyphomicrobiaceae bacterium]|nr:head-tail connector protein [Hyphomicrobiaceae bacterium]